MSTNISLDRVRFCAAHGQPRRTVTRAYLQTETKGENLDIKYMNLDRPTQSHFYMVKARTCTSKANELTTRSYDIQLMRESFRGEKLRGDQIYTSKCRVKKYM